MNLVTLDFENILRRFTPKHTRPKQPACWEWTASCDAKGYGHFYVLKNGKSFMSRAHIISYMLHKGDIANGLVVRHVCDNPCCVNPEHLLLGTQADNVRDRDERGRRKPPMGTMNGRAKINEFVVRFIRQSDLGNLKLSKITGLGITQIKRIKNRESWTCC